MHMKSALVLMFIGSLSLILISAAPPENKGAPEISIDAASKGHVGFPHRRHQESLGDCKLCHTLFPQEANSIRKNITAGTLKKKEVMGHCRDCHSKKVAAGEKAGPTSCAKCHPK
jgi:c(7)-type cytochrome triheme protein